MAQVKNEEEKKKENVKKVSKKTTETKVCISILFCKLFYIKIY